MFDNPIDLLAKIRLGEDTFLELKEVRFAGHRVSAPHRDSLADELAAFANSRGGVCVLGVDGQRQVRGIPIERLTLPDPSGVEQPVVRVDMPRSLFVHRSPGGYLHRVGSAKREMAPDYLARLFQQRSQARIIRFDEQPVPGATLDDLRPDLWQRFASPRQKDSREVLLDKLAMARPDADGTLRPTVAGVLMASADPRRWLPNAFIQAVAHRDYAIHGAKIRLRVFADRLELHSPGAIPNTMTVESLPYRQAARNEALTSLLAKCVVAEEDQVFTGRSTMMDKRGEGVQVILDSSERLSGQRPVYRMVDEAELVLVVPAARFEGSEGAVPS